MKITLIIAFQLLLIVTYAQNKTPNRVPNRINEERFIQINGIAQWITIKGDSSKPIILFVHGGPGNPLSPYADAIYGKWEKDFTLVQWDQRGSGKTYGHNAPEELTPDFIHSNPLTIEQVTSDGIELVKYLTHRFKKKKVILFGTSWGSILGVKMSLKSPELFYAYVGHAQIVDYTNGQKIAYKKVHGLAMENDDSASLKLFASIGSPPYDTARHTGLFNRVIQKYQQAISIPAPSAWFDMSPQYDNPKDNQNRLDGEDYSFVCFVGDKRLGIASSGSAINFFSDGLKFKIPVYLIQGEMDIQTPEVISREYFNQLTAPEKKFILLPNTAHGFNQTVINAQYKIVTQDLKKLLSIK
jgi:pimeloyl-ACP methyl ester carboxylesterase